MNKEKKPDWFLEWIKKLTAKQKITYSIILLCCIPLISYILVKIDPTSNVDPCKCAEFPGKVALIGYDNLSSEDKKIFDACEKRYRTTSDAMNACIEKVKK